MQKIVVMGYRCQRCRHQWTPRKKQLPKRCPKCKSPYWNKPRKQKTKQG